MGKPFVKQIMLSPSALNLFLDCPKCFWLEKVKRFKRPRGIFPSLPSGMDRVIKTYFDAFRSQLILPPELEKVNIKGVRLFPDQSKLNLWRDWKTGLRYESSDRRAAMIGALDDLLVCDDQYIPFDYKTKGSKTTEEDAVRYYQNQLDCYSFMLEANGMKTRGFGLLCYYSPHSVASGGKVAFEVQLIRVQTDPKRAQKTFESALQLLNQSKPVVGPACEYCAYRDRSPTL